MPLSFLLHPQEEVEDDFAEDLPRGEQPVSVVEVERNSVPDSSPSVPPLPAPPKTAGLSSTSQQASEHIHDTSRDLSAVMDAVHALATTTTTLEATQTVLDKRKARAEVTLA